MQYAQTFNNLSQYAGYHVDTDEKKQACFRQGLSSKLQDRLAMFKFNTFSELVNGAIVQEDAHLAHKAEKKRKTPAAGSSSSNPQRFRLVQTIPQGLPSSTSLCTGHHSSSGDISHLSNHSHREWLGLLFLHRASRRFGCRSRGCAQICSYATTADSLDTSNVIAPCRRSKDNRPVSRIRKAKSLTSNRDKCITPPLRVFRRELQ